MDKESELYKSSRANCQFFFHIKFCAVLSFGFPSNFRILTAPQLCSKLYQGKELDVLADVFSTALLIHHLLLHFPLRLPHGISKLQIPRANAFLSYLQDARAAEERAGKAENKLQEAHEQSQYDLRNQIHDLEIQLRDKETSYQGLQEEQATLHQQIQSAKAGFSALFSLFALHLCWKLLLAAVLL